MTLESGGGFRVGNYLRALRRSVWFLLLGGILGSAAAFAVFLGRPPLYTSHSTLEVYGLNENFMNLSQVDPQAGIGLYSATASNLLTQIQILRSASLREKVIERLRLESFPPERDEDDYVTRLRRKLNIIPSDRAKRSRAALAKAVKSFRPGVVRETRIIEVQCQSTNPDVAALFLRTLVEEFIDQGLASRTVSSGRTSEWLHQQLSEAKLRLDAAEQKLASFGRETGYMAPTPSDTLSGSKLRQLREELSASQAERIRTQSEYDKLRNAPKDLLGSLVDDAQVRSAEASLLELKKSLADLLTTFTAGHPQVKRISAQIAEVQRDVDAARAAVLERAKARNEMASHRESLLTKAYSSQNRVLSGEHVQAGQRLQLQREVEIALQQYNSLLEQVSQASMAAVIPSEHIRVIDAARPSPESEGLKMIPTILLGLFSGLLLGVAVVVTREGLSGKIGWPTQSETLFNVPQIAVIPPMALGDGSGPARSKALTRNLLGLRPQMPAESPLELQRWGAVPRSLYVESFRRAVAALLSTGGSSSRCRVLVVTSAGPGEGKTTVTANLGIAISETGSRTLLIDMDLRQPDLHSRFGLDPSSGLVAALASIAADTPHQPIDCIKPTAFPWLDVLPAREVTAESISKVLYHPSFGHLISRLRSQYDFILIDTPPVGPFSDARVLGRHSDGIILVLRAGKTTKDSVTQILPWLAGEVTPLVGTILNDALPEGFAQGYYRYYNRSEKQA